MSSDTFNQYLSEQDLIEAREIADLLKEGNFAMAQENLDAIADNLDNLQRVALRDAVKHYRLN